MIYAFCEYRVKYIAAWADIILLSRYMRSEHFSDFLQLYSFLPNVSSEVDKNFQFPPMLCKMYVFVSELDFYDSILIDYNHYIRPFYKAYLWYIFYVSYFSFWQAKIYMTYLYILQDNTLNSPRWIWTLKSLWFLLFDNYVRLDWHLKTGNASRNLSSYPILEVNNNLSFVVYLTLHMSIICLIHRMLSHAF